MSYVSFNDVIELNGILKDKGLNFRIHLRDTCGRQSFWIEPLGNCACEGRYDEMYHSRRRILIRMRSLQIRRIIRMQWREQKFKFVFRCLNSE